LQKGWVKRTIFLQTDENYKGVFVGKVENTLFESEELYQRNMYLPYLYTDSMQKK
jgi:hypothetical protein